MINVYKPTQQNNKIKVLLDLSEVSEKINGASRYALNVYYYMYYYYSEVFAISILKNPNVEKEKIAHMARIPSNSIKIIENVTPIGIKREIKYRFYIRPLLKNYEVFFCPTEKWPVSINGGILVLHDARALEEIFIGLNCIKKGILKYMLNNGIEKSTSIICVSETTKKIFLDNYGNKIENKARVVYHPYEKMNKNIDGMKIEGDYFFFYGQLWRPHKNIDRLISAFLLFKKMHPEYKQYKLFLAGEDKGSFNKEKLADEGIIMLGYVAEKDLVSVLLGSKALVYVSLYEGFGIPILNAISNGVTVVCSDIKVFKELYTGAVIFVQPESIESISKGLHIAASGKNENKDFDMRRFEPELFARDHFEIFMETAEKIRVSRGK